MPTPRMPAARHALRVLALLAEHLGPVRAQTIARELAIPRSTTYDLLAVMRDEGFLVHYPELGAWGPSARVARIGSRVDAATRIERLGQPLLDRLVRASPVPATAHLAVLSGVDVRYAGRGAARRSPTTVSSVGVRLPAVRTATGRALLAALDDAQVRALVPHDADLAGGEPATRAALGRMLADVRTRGWALERGDVDAAYGSVAAAAIDAVGDPVAGVGVTVRLDDADRADAWPALQSLVVDVARDLSARLAAGRRSTGAPQPARRG